jgi:hypothetical protein
MVDVAGEPRVRTTVVEDVVVGTNIARRLLAATMRKDSKPI